MKALTVVLPALLILLLFCSGPAAWGQSEPGYVSISDSYQEELLSPEDLEELVAPIALYPDPMIAQILPAATFVDQIDDAADFLRRYGVTPRIEDQRWDISVKAIAHYPDVIYMMDENYEWTVALGQAFVTQQQDLMDAIQRLRLEARERGNLYSTSEQQVIYDQDVVRIVPASPEYIYVPVYDPAVVYVEQYIPSYPFITFGMGYGIGAWLNRDCNWRERRVYYHGWRGDGWVHRARPHVRDRRGTYINRRASIVRVDDRVLLHDSRRFRSELRNDSWRIRERRGLTTPGSTVTRPGRTTRERYVPGEGVTRPGRTYRDRTTPGSTVTRPERRYRDRTTPGATVTRPDRTNRDRTTPGSTVTRPGRTNVERSAPGSAVTTPGGSTNVGTPPASVVTTPADPTAPGSTTPGASGRTTRRDRTAPGRTERRGRGGMIVPGTTTNPPTTVTPRTGRTEGTGATGTGGTQRRQEGIGRGRGAGPEQRAPGSSRRRNSGNLTSPAGSAAPSTAAAPARSRAASPVGGSANVIVQPSPSVQPPSGRPAIVQPPASVQPPPPRRPATQRPATIVVPPPSVQPPASAPRVVVPSPSVVHPPPSVQPPKAVQPPAATVTTPRPVRPDFGHRPAVPPITTTTPPLSTPVQQRHEGVSPRSGGFQGDRSGRHMQQRR